MLTVISSLLVLRLGLHSHFKLSKGEFTPGGEITPFYGTLPPPDTSYALRI